MTLKTIISACVFVLCSLSLPSYAQKGRGSLDAMNGEVLRLINEHRNHMGLKSLTNEPHIIKAAERHSKDMATHRVPFGHDGFDERVDKLMKDIKHSSGSAENVAYGSRTAAAVVDMWLHSAGHKKNIEGNYNLTGIGIAADKDGTLFFTQIFIKN